MKTTTYTCGDKLVAFEKVEDLLFQLIAELITIFSEAELMKFKNLLMLPNMAWHWKR